MLTLRRVGQGPPEPKPQAAARSRASCRRSQGRRPCCWHRSSQAAAGAHRREALRDWNRRRARAGRGRPQARSACPYQAGLRRLRPARAKRGARVIEPQSLRRIEAQPSRIGKVLAERAELHVDLPHRDVERRLAHLRQPNQNGFLVDARPLEVVAEVTEHAGRGAIVATARGRGEPSRAARMHAAERAAEIIKIALRLTRGACPTGRRCPRLVGRFHCGWAAEICGQNQRPQPYRHCPNVDPAARNATPITSRRTRALSRFG